MLTAVATDIARLPGCSVVTTLESIEVIASSQFAESLLR